MPSRTLLTAAILVLGSLPALAQGYARGTFGTTGSGVPSNPFASNYPSAPPAVALERRDRRAVRRISREPSPVPPGRIPR